MRAVDDISWIRVAQVVLLLLIQILLSFLQLPCSYLIETHANDISRVELENGVSIIDELVTIVRVSLLSLRVLLLLVHV